MSLRPSQHRLPATQSRQPFPSTISATHRQHNPHPPCCRSWLEESDDKRRAKLHTAYHPVEKMVIPQNITW